MGWQRPTAAKGKKEGKNLDVWRRSRNTSYTENYSWDRDKSTKEAIALIPRTQHLPKIEVYSE